MIELPLVAEELAELLGLDLALRLVEAWGGTSIYVPEKVPAEHWLTELLGAEGAALLAERYGRDILRLPRCLSLLVRRRNEEIRAKHVDGKKSARELALEYRMTERHIWRILTDEAAPDPNQLTLL